MNAFSCPMYTERQLYNELYVWKQMYLFINGQHLEKPGVRCFSPPCSVQGSGFQTHPPERQCRGCHPRENLVGEAKATFLMTCLLRVVPSASVHPVVDCLWSGDWWPRTALEPQWSLTGHVSISEVDSDSTWGGCWARTALEPQWRLATC